MERSKNRAETGRAGHSRAETGKQIQRSRDSSNINMERFYRSAMSLTPAPGKMVQLHPIDSSHPTFPDSIWSHDLRAPVSDPHNFFTCMQDHQRGRWWVWFNQVSKVWQKRPLSMASIALCQKDLYVQLNLESISTSCVNYIITNNSAVSDFFTCPKRF